MNVKITTGQVLAYTQILEIFNQWFAPIYVTPGQFLLQKHPEMIGVVGIISFIEDCTAIHVDWTIDADKNKSKILPQLTTEKYFCSDLKILWHPGMEAPLPNEILNRLEISFRPAINKIKDDVVVINPMILEQKPHLKQWIKHVGVVKPLTQQFSPTAASDIMVIMSPATWITDVQASRNSIIVPETTSWIKIDRLDCICVPSVFAKYLGMCKKNNGDGSSSLVSVSSKSVIVTPQKEPIVSAPIKAKSKFNVNDIVCVNWDCEQLKNKKLFGMVGIVEKIIDKGDTYGYSINFDTVPNKSLSLCENVNMDETAITDEVDEYCLSDVHSKLGFSPVEQIHLRYSSQGGANRTFWNMRDKKNIIVTSITEGGTVYAKNAVEENGTSNFASELKGGVRNIDYNYNKDKLLKIIGEADSLIPAIEIHNKTPYLYVYGFDEFSENQNIMVRVLLGQVIDKKRNVKKLKKWMDKANGQSFTSVLKYLEIQSLGRIFHLLDKVCLTTLIFKEAK